MKRCLVTLACLSSFTLAAAQQRPYQLGDVDACLAAAERAGRPTIVLFNFDDKSG